MRIAKISSLLLLAFASCAPAAPRPVDSNLFVSERAPALTLAIDPAFRPLAPLRFSIETLTDVERRIFVDAAADGKVRRMIVIQRERALAGSDFRFVFPSIPPRRFGAEVYRAGAFAYDEAAEAAAKPLREPGQTRRHLAASHLEPPRYWKVARLARVSDPQGLTEIILFYMENGDRAYAGAAPPRDADGDIVIGEAERERLLRALEAAVRPIRG
jgi:hypothetical protein